MKKYFKIVSLQLSLKNAPTLVYIRHQIYLKYLQFFFFIWIKTDVICCKYHKQEQVCIVIVSCTVLLKSRPTLM